LGQVGRPPYVLTEADHATIVAAVRKGMNYTRAAYLVGISRETLHNVRQVHPTLDRDMARALSEWDMDQIEAQAAFTAEGDTQGAERMAKIRAMRLPQWYSPDSRMRRDHEMHVTDEDNAPPTGGVDIAEAIAALLAAKKSGAL
jgi:hypothetical protein